MPLNAYFAEILALIMDGSSMSTQKPECCHLMKVRRKHERAGTLHAQYNGKSERNWICEGKTREGGMASQAEDETHHQSIDSTPERKLDKGC